jgi:hypothetical protein
MTADEFAGVGERMSAVRKMRVQHRKKAWIMSGRAKRSLELKGNGRRRSRLGPWPFPVLLRKLSSSHDGFE